MQKASMSQPTGGPFVERDDVLSWGRVVREPQRVAKPHFRDELPRLIAEAPRTSKLAIGLRRSYGNSCLNGAGVMIDATGLDRFIAFDPETGRLRAEAGASLSSVLQLVVPHGWFLPTTPGTRFVTLGGAVANDVHGKNHHRAATFGASVVAVGLLRSDGRRLTLTPLLEPDLFSATIGGLGLTGVIDWVELQLAPIRSATLRSKLCPTITSTPLAACARKRRPLRAHCRLDRLPVARSATRPWGFHPRELGRRWTVCRPRRSHVQERADRFSRLCAQQTVGHGFQQALLRPSPPEAEGNPAALFDVLIRSIGPELEPAVWLARASAVPMRNSLGRRTRPSGRVARYNLPFRSARSGGMKTFGIALSRRAVLPPAGRDAHSRFPQPGRGNARPDGPSRRHRARRQWRSLSGQGRAHAGGHVQARLSPPGRPSPH